MSDECGILWFHCYVTVIFQTFRRAETTFVNINEINNMTLIMPSSSTSSSSNVKPEIQAGDKKTKKKGRKKGTLLDVNEIM